MKEVLLKCHHGNLVKTCILCTQELEQFRSFLHAGKLEEDKRVPILRGCPNEQCFCTGRCKEVIGYYE